MDIVTTLANEWKPYHPGYLDYSKTILRPSNANSLIQMSYFRSTTGMSIKANVSFLPSASGPHGISHGGLISALFDEVFIATSWLKGPFSVTRSLNVEYLQSLPTQTPAVLIAHVDSTLGRNIKVVGELKSKDEEKIYARGHGLFVPVKEKWISAPREPHQELVRMKS